MKKLMISRNLFVLVCADMILVAFSYVLAYIVRFEANIPETFQMILKNTIAPIILCKLVIFYFFSLYRGMWRYTSIVDLLNIIKAIMVSSAVIVFVILMLSRFQGFSRSVFIIDAVFSLVFISGIRILIRLFLSTQATTGALPFNFKTRSDNGKKRLIIIGAGDAAEKVVREINDNQAMKVKVIGLVDDDKTKTRKQIHGINILGRIGDLNDIIVKHNVDEILIAIPSANGKKMRKIIEICDSTKIPYKTLPGLGEIINGKISIKAIRDISYNDLIGRAPVRLENDNISKYLKEKCVLITGAGGSIGSELCRQVCKFRPALVILFDASESNLYSIQMELKHNVTYVKYRAVLGRVQDRGLVDSVLKKYKPNVIFHAAAYKHVPLLELNPWEVVFSNIVGTHTLAQGAVKHQVERFVFVSSDKAVRPTNVMGASKRVAEKIIQSQTNGCTRFMAVRFGNVLGSSGSVIPLFQQQILRGGPITVTHPDITRYFMTVEEAAQLILQAFTMGQGGEIFILEMGTPIKIVDMATDLICLSDKALEDIGIIFYRPQAGGKAL